VNTVYPSPKVLLLAPPPLGTGFHNPEEWAGGPEKSQVLGSVLKDAAAAASLPFLNAGEFISTEGIDGVHLTAEAQRKLGGAVAEKVRVVLGET
jgi:lysophospholipase L1-like esterase